MSAVINLDRFRAKHQAAQENRRAAECDAPETEEMRRHREVMAALIYPGIIR